MPRSLVLGLGNPLSGADAFGPAIVERLEAHGGLPSVELVSAHTDLLAHMDRFADHDRVVLVDAVLTSGGGGVAVYTEEEFAAWDDRSRGAHALSPLMVVKLFRAMQAGPEGAGLRGKPDPPEITLVALLVDESAFGRPPTDADVAAGAAAVRGLTEESGDNGGGSTTEKRS